LMDQSDATRGSFDYPAEQMGALSHPVLLLWVTEGQPLNWTKVEQGAWGTLILN
jgi:hypothetical protein